MVAVLVTGGTGTLGRRLVPALADRGHQVRVLTHRRGVGLAGVEGAHGDVRTGEGVARAADGVDVVLHAATSPYRRVKETEVRGTAHVVDAARRAGAHLIYVSIVGVDRLRFPYYRAKWEAEQLVAGAGAPWTIQRATQFHELLDPFLSGPVFIRTPRLAFQPVAVAEVAGRLADLAGAEPQGRAPDMGGPEVLGIRELAAIRGAVAGRAARLVPVPPIGVARAFDEGHHLCPDHRTGTLTWRQWLERRPPVSR